jgi:hypothetical protein
MEDKFMNRTAALHTLVTALILFTVVGALYSADQQKKAALLSQGAAATQATWSMSDDMVSYGDVVRDEKMLGCLALVAAGFLMTSFFLYRSKNAALAGFVKARPAWATKTARSNWL